MELLKLRYAGVCRECGGAVSRYEDAYYDRPAKKIVCVECYEQAAVSDKTSVAEVTEAPDLVLEIDNRDATVPSRDFDRGIPGASAQREFERRAAKRERNVREKHPKLGGFLLAITDDPQHTKAWNGGAKGESVVGNRLSELEVRGVITLHDRRIPGSRANIDHIAIAASGVWVIDAKRYVDKRPELRVEGGFLRPRVEKLLVGGRDQNKLLDGLYKQRDVVKKVLADSQYGEVPVNMALCFVDADWPLFGGGFVVNGVHATYTKALEKKLLEPGTLNEEDVWQLAAYLADKLKAA